MKTISTTTGQPGISPPHPIITRVAKVILDNSLAVDGDTIIVAVSGGSDSLALLYILKSIELNLRLFAAYIDHGLRPHETPAEKELIAGHCQYLEVPFHEFSVDVKQLISEDKRSPEEAARILRYRALEQFRLAVGAKSIAIAHTADDQVEEFFLRLFRGSGGKGLSGMLLHTSFIIRPLLHETKQELRRFLSELAVSWAEDSSNADRRFLRNRVRLDLLPFIEREFNPSVRKTILKTMAILQTDEGYMEEQARLAYQHAVTKRRVTYGTTNNYELLLNHKTFQNLHRAIAFRVLERCCIESGYKSNSKQLESLNTLLLANKRVGEIHLGGCVRAAKKGPYLVLSRTLTKSRAARNQIPIALSPRTIPRPGLYDIKELGKVLRLTVKEVSSLKEKKFNELLIDYNTVTFPLLLRAAQAGERFFPCNGIGEKKVNRFFNQLKIPKMARHLYPVLLENDKIIAIPGLQVDQHCRVTDTTASVLVISWNDKEEDRCNGENAIL